MSDRVRLSIDISAEQYDALYRLVPWGLKRTLFSRLIDMLIPLIEKDPGLVVEAILMKKLILAVKEE